MADAETQALPDDNMGDETEPNSDEEEQASSFSLLTVPLLYLFTAVSVACSKTHRNRSGEREEMR